MSEIISQAQEPDLASGDRIRIRQGKRSIPNLVGRVGTIVEVFRMPRDSCLVLIDGDTDRLREWFFYRDELVTGIV